MNFIALPLLGAYKIEAELISDNRGFFTRLICAEEFQTHGLDCTLVQASMSQNRLRGTLRGMHLQISPYGETKLVRVTRGSIYDVIIDLRSASPTYLQHFAVELSARLPASLYIPAGFAHGFQTLEDDTEVYYHMNQEFSGASARTFLWSDPQFAITWPLPNPILSEKDAQAPLFHRDLLS